MVYNFLILFSSLIGFCCCYYYEEESRPTFLTAGVGEHVIFNCDLDFPQGIRIPYMVKWNKDVRIFDLSI